MICPTCKEEGRKSCVRTGVGMSTLAHDAPVYDEDGRLHSHDGNTRTMSYRCGNGHAWTEATTGSCWCGWPDKKEV